MKKIIIIGGGIAGLSAGIYGLKAGYEVEIYEKNAVPGGECMGWNRKGHHIDNCIHWLTGTKQGTPMREMWEELGALNKDSVFIKSDKFFTSCTKGTRVVLWRNLEKTEKELIELSPEDAEEIRKFIVHVKYAMNCQLPIDKPMDMFNLFDYIKLGKEMADMPKINKEYGKASISGLAERFKHPAIQNMFKDYLPHEYQATALFVSYATVVSGNGEMPAGGSLKMTQRIVKTFEALSGKLFLDCTVKKIKVEDNKAKGIILSDGREVLGDYVISAADTKELYSRLLDKQYMDDIWRTAYSDEKSYSVFSAFQTAYSIDTDAFEETGTIFFDCEPYEINSISYDRMSVRTYEYEPEFAPVGKTVLQSNIMQFDDDYRYWKSLDREQYLTVKKELAQTIEDRITSAFPSLKGHIELIDSFTPITYERYCNAYHGAYMSFMMKTDVKPLQTKGTIKKIPNLFIASQWLQSPGGLPTAAATGKFAIQRIMKLDKKGK